MRTPGKKRKSSESTCCFQSQAVMEMLTGSTRTALGSPKHSNYSGYYLPGQPYLMMMMTMMMKSTRRRTTTKSMIKAKMRAVTIMAIVTVVAMLATANITA